MAIKKVGVVGCGFMGSGITQVCAQSGYPVVVAETNNELLKKGLASIDYYLTRGVERGRISQKEKDAILARIKGTTSTRDFNECDLVIEVVPEDLKLKKKVFAEIDKICPPHTILSTNTSCLPIAEIAAVTSRPDKVIGTHFLSPVPPSQLLEIVRPATTSDETLATVKKFGQSLGKAVIVAKDTPGFVFNWLLVSLQQAALHLMESGIATKEDIDTAMTLGLGHQIGPIALADFNGLDVSYMVTRAMYQQTKDPWFTPSPLMKKLFDAGQLGRKTGRGFYNYKE